MRARAFLPAASLMLAALMAPLAPPRRRPCPIPTTTTKPRPRLPAKPARWQTVELGKPGHRYKIPVYANRPLGKGELADIKQVVVVIHGVKRDADRYYEYVTDLLERNPERARDTLVLAPRFSGSIDSGFAGMAAWRKASWEEGEDSVQAAGRPAPVSSFQVLDDLLRSLDDRQRLPALAGIVLAGHSGGAQLVQRYAVLNNVDGPLRRDGLALRYVIANPSSYLYLTNERPRPDGKGYAPYERGICPTYNQYKYGTDKLPAYARGQEESRLFVRYAARDVTYLLGGADNNPEHRLLDKTCGAEAQGSTRLARGTAYLQYEFLLVARRQAGHAAPRRLRSARRGPRRQEHVRLGMRRPGPAGRRRARDGQGRALRADQAARQVAPARHRPGRPPIMTAS